jgi:hypothetical protein
LINENKKRKGVQIMFKATLFCSAVLAMLSCVAGADLIVATTTPPDCPVGFKLQHQSFAVGGINLVGLAGSGGTATNSNVATIYQNQNDQKICSWGEEQQVVTFVQDGCAGATCGGAWSVGQTALVTGSQLQIIGDGCGSKMEYQSLGVDLGNQVTKIDGSGAATGIHSLGVVQQQAAGNSGGQMSQTNAVAAGQYSTVAGGPSTEAQVTSALVVGTTQTNVDL